MKWMGWDWDAYCAAPVDLVTEIKKMMIEEMEAVERAGR